MRIGTHAGRAVIKFTRLGFHQCGKFLQRIRRHSWVHHQHAAPGGNRGNGGKIARHVVRQIGHQAWRAEHRRARPANGVTIRLRPRQHFGTDHRVTARAVIHHHRVTPFFRQLTGDKTPHRIGAAAGRKRNNVTHRPGGVILLLRPCRTSGSEQQQRRQQTDNGDVKTSINTHVSSS